MIGRFRTIRAKPERADQLASLVARLQCDVRANEPDVLLYQCMRSVEDPALFVLTEIFRDAKAQAAHDEAPHHVRVMAQGWAYVDGEVAIRPFAPLTEADIGPDHP